MTAKERWKAQQSARRRRALIERLQEELAREFEREIRENQLPWTGREFLKALLDTQRPLQVKQSRRIYATWPFGKNDENR